MALCWISKLKESKTLQFQHFSGFCRQEVFNLRITSSLAELKFEGKQDKVNKRKVLQFWRYFVSCKPEIKEKLKRKLSYFMSH